MLFFLAGGTTDSPSTFRWSLAIALAFVFAAGAACVRASRNTRSTRTSRIIQFGISLALLGIGVVVIANTVGFWSR